VRVAKVSRDSQAALMASIAAEGLLQNLVVVPQGEQFAVIAGERWLQALRGLAAAGRIAGDYPVHCAVRGSEARVTAISLAENFRRDAAGGSGPGLRAGGGHPTAAGLLPRELLEDGSTYAIRRWRVGEAIEAEQGITAFDGAWPKTTPSGAFLHRVHPPGCRRLLRANGVPGRAFGMEECGQHRAADRIIG
tara:strand:- start:618 stop:1193 length:576 start_codon:yes stop_codon:yes gene_type:complete